MTPTEFIRAYTDLDSKIGVQQVMLKVVRERLSELEDAQAVLSISHLDELTPLREGQTIEIASRDAEGHHDWNLPVHTAVLGDVMQADVADPDDASDRDLADPSGDRTILIAVWNNGGRSYADTLILTPQPGRQWRYPTDSTSAAVAGTERTLP